MAEERAGAKEAWTCVVLGDLVTIKHGWPFKSELFSEELTGRPIVVSIGNFKYTGGFRFESTTTKEYTGDYPDEFELEPGDILIVMTCQTPGGEILGIPARVPRDGRVYLHNQRMGKVVVKPGAPVHADFLYWQFLSKEFNRELVATASGTKILHTAPVRIENYKFYLPPLAEQSAIAQILGTIDGKIDLLRRMNRSLEQAVRTIFQSWFVHFDAVRSKAHGRKPIGVDADSARLFPRDFEGSKIGPIPKGWRVGSVADLADDIRDVLDPVDMGGGEAYVGLEHIPRRSLWIDACGAASSAQSAKLAFRKNDILFGKLRPYFHKVALVDFSGVCSTDIIVARPKKAEYRALTALYMSEDAFIAHASAHADGTRMPRTRWSDLCRHEIVIPVEPVAEAFERCVEPYVTRALLNVEHARALADLRDILLPKLLSGAVRVPDAERFIVKEADI